MICRPWDGLLKERGHRRVATHRQFCPLALFSLALHCLFPAVSENGPGGPTEALRVLGHQFWHLFLICLRWLRCFQSVHKSDNRSMSSTICCKTYEVRLTLSLIAGFLFFSEVISYVHMAYWIISKLNFSWALNSYFISLFPFPPELQWWHFPSRSFLDFGPWFPLYQVLIFRGKDRVMAS